MNDEVKRLLDDSMTVEQLIKKLLDMPRNAAVLFSHPYGDRCNTMQALPVLNVDVRDVKYLRESAYSTSRVAIRDEDSIVDDVDGDDVVVITA